MFPSHDHGAGQIDLQTDNGSTPKTRMRMTTSGDVQFYENDGTTVGARWDTSAGNFGFGGQLTPQKEIDVTGDIRVTGGVYFGTTATGDYLDDYEEGTWTPEYKTGSSEDADPVYSADGLTAGRYTKIGRVVHAIGRIRTDTLTSEGAADAQLAVSLPLTVSSDGSIDKQFGVLVVGETKTFNNNFFPHAGWASRNTQLAYLVRRTASAGQTQSLNSDDALNTADNANDLVFSITYLTD